MGKNTFAGMGWISLPMPLSNLTAACTSSLLILSFLRPLLTTLFQFLCDRPCPLSSYRGQHWKSRKIVAASCEVDSAYGSLVFSRWINVIAEWCTVVCCRFVRWVLESSVASLVDRTPKRAWLVPPHWSVSCCSYTLYSCTVPTTLKVGRLGRWWYI